MAQSSPMQSSIEKQRAAAALQRESVRKQVEAAASWLGRDPSAPLAAIPEPACEPIPDATVTPLIESVAKQQTLAPKLLRAVIEQESGFRPCAVSPKGAQGLMQLMPATADRFGVKDVFDPKENIDAGAKFLKQLLDKYGGDLAQALGAYNAGPTTVDQSGGVPQIPETQDYVKAILQKLGVTRTDPPSIPMPKPIEN
jgi:soluble lytic murein transglycosylase-like protein